MAVGNKDCPFCGGSPKLVVRDLRSGLYAAHVECVKCGSRSHQVRFGNKEYAECIAWDTWNFRKGGL